MLFSWQCYAPRKQ
ncbi:hypothetical protein EC100869_3960, partial [Escherichia coli 10.0869]